MAKRPVFISLSKADHLVNELYFEFKERYPTELDYLLEVKNISRSDGSARYERWRWNIGRFLNEACINGGKHGNKMQADKLLTIRRHYGEFGVLYEVEDEGEGFNVGKMIETFIKWKEGKIKVGEPSYHSGSGGTGSVLFDLETNNIVTYNQKGNIIYFQYLLQSQKLHSN